MIIIHHYCADGFLLVFPKSSSESFLIESLERIAVLFSLFHHPHPHPFSLLNALIELISFPSAINEAVLIMNDD
jgi:hypothetical protein